MGHVLRVQCEELKSNHLTPLLVVIMPCACWFLWRVDYFEDFKWCLHFQIGVAFWRVVLREVYLEESNLFWRALKTSILNTARRGALSLFWKRTISVENEPMNYVGRRPTPNYSPFVIWLHKSANSSSWRFQASLWTFQPMCSTNLWTFWIDVWFF